MKSFLSVDHKFCYFHSSISECFYEYSYVYISSPLSQGGLQVKDFDISKEAGGAEREITRRFVANVTDNHLEIHLLWAGKGTCCVPELGYYGPSISAISVVPGKNINTYQSFLQDP